MSGSSDNNNPFISDNDLSRLVKATGGKHYNEDYYASTQPLARKKTVFKTLMSIVADLCIISAVMSGCFFVWLQIWTGVESLNEQKKLSYTVSSRFVNNNIKRAKIANAQASEPPEAEELSGRIPYGSVVGQIYAPRFGSGWSRVTVEGTDYAQLRKGGLAHYVKSAKPGEIGLFALAGHVNGYGQPLGELDKLQNGDSVIFQTKNYWYVYEQYDRKIVSRYDKTAIADVPFKPYDKPHERLMALTTCWPKYSMDYRGAPSRMVSYLKFKYWARTSDGIPIELEDKNSTSNNSTMFYDNNVNNNTLWFYDKTNILTILIGLYIVLFVASAAIFGFLGIKKWGEQHLEGRTTFSVISWLFRVQPGCKILQITNFIILTLILLCLIVFYVCPWGAANIPVLSLSAGK